MAGLSANKSGQSLIAERTALAAVCPRPHKLASVIVQPTSCQPIHVAGKGLARRDPLQDFLLPLRSHLAGVALAARLVGKEMAQALEGQTQVPGVIENHHDPGTEGQASLAKVFKGQAHIELIERGEGAGCTAKEHGLQPSASGDAASHLQQFPQGHAEWHFVHAGPRYIARQAE